jgi:hypothetical protein
MTDEVPPERASLHDENEKIGKALKRAARKAIIEHARAGQPVAVLRDGAVIWLQPAEAFAMLQRSQETEKNGPASGQ